MKTLEELIMRRDQIMIEKSQNLEDLGSIRNQVDTAKTRALAEGQYADSDWFRRAQSALRHKGRLDQDLATELSSVNRQIKQLNKGDPAQMGVKQIVATATTIYALCNDSTVWRFDNNKWEQLPGIGNDDY